MQGEEMSTTNDEYRSRSLEQKKAAIDSVTSECAVLRDEISGLEKIDLVYSNSRLLLFLAAAFCLLYSVKSPSDRECVTFASLTAVFSIAFTVIVVLHEKSAERLARKRAGLVLGEERLSRMGDVKRKMKGARESLTAEKISHEIFSESDFGSRQYEAVSDETAADLDFFSGAQNIFGLYDTTQSSPGKTRFIRRLKCPPAGHAEVVARQEAVRELSARRVNVDSIMLEVYPLRGIRFSEFIEVTESEGFLSAFRCLRTPALFFSAAPVASLIFWGYEAAMFFYAFNFILTGFFIEKFSKMKKLYSNIPRIVGVFEKLRAAITRDKFVSGVTNSACAPFITDTESTGVILRKIVSATQAFLIPLPAMLDAVVLYSLNAALISESRIRENRALLMSLCESTAELESLCALANIKIDQPEYNFPTILREDKPEAVLTNLLHPFIPFEYAVSNSLDLGRDRAMAIVTGSNMSGKSTYLKAVAIALILARTGAPVRAEKAVMTPFSVMTDIRITDSITLGISYFYSELLRMKSLSDALEETPFVFGAFDELFNGTNSAERLALGTAAIEYFKEAGGRFMIATHDRELTALEIPGDPAVFNIHFEETGSGDDRVFTHRLLPGPAPGTNAVELARTCGLPKKIWERAAKIIKG